MKNISIASKCYSQGENSITIANLTESEMNELLAAFRGLSWFGVEDGRLKTSPCHLALPHATEDEEMLPFWRQFSHNQLQNELFEKMFDEVAADVICMPHFTIQSLCGYGYSPENYVRESEKLTNWGFIQLRSRRGEDGSYWEHWHLPGVWFAKGDLKELVDSITIAASTWEDPSGRRKDKECFKAVLEFLRRNASFGTLDVSVQRLCQVYED